MTSYFIYVFLWISIIMTILTLYIYIHSPKLLIYNYSLKKYSCNSTGSLSSKCLRMTEQISRSEQHPKDVSFYKYL